MSRFELVIFDCDGVLVDSEIISARILIEKLQTIGVDVDLGYVLRNFVGRSWATVASEIRNYYGQNLSSDFEEEYRRDLLKAFESELNVTEGLLSVLDNLNVTSCIATSSSPRRVKRTMELTGLDAHFSERVFTASQVTNGKPAPDLFVFAAKTMNVPPEKCLVIEDSMPGITAAIRAKMTVWRFMGGSHLKNRNLGSLNAGVTTFDHWDQFFTLAPDLKIQQNRVNG